MVCFPPLAEQSRIVTSVCVLALGNLRHHLPTVPVAFIYRFGSSLNGRIHFHVCVVDGVFAEVAGKHWTSRNLPIRGRRVSPHNRITLSALPDLHF